MTDASLIFSHRAIKPAVPELNMAGLYVKTDDNLYIQGNDGVERLVGGGTEKYLKFITPNDPEWVGTPGVPLTTTSYDGNDTVTTGAITIDTSAVFGAPAGIKACAVYLYALWGTSNTNYFIGCRETGLNQNKIAVRSLVANVANEASGIVTCDSNGDFDLVVGGLSANNVILRIWGYWIEKSIISVENIVVSDGWIPLTAFLEYDTATSVKIPGGYDLQNVFPVGTRIKLTQTTVKYFYVRATAYSSGNTYLYLAAGTDYTIVNANITEFHYAHGVAYGFPEWFNWVPEWTAITTNPTIGNGWILGQFALLGKLCTAHFHLRFGTTTNPGVGNWEFSLPLKSAATYPHGQFLPEGHGYAADFGSPRKYSVVIPLLPSNTSIIPQYYWVIPPTGYFLSSVSPFTWSGVTASQLNVQITYPID